MAQQSIALSKAEQNALSVTYNVMGTEVTLDLAFVKKYLVRGRSDLVSDQEIVLFINTCKMQKLNPLVQGDVYLIKYSKDDPAQMVVGKDAYLRRADDHPDYRHKKDGIVVIRNGEILQKEGCCVYPGEELIGGWCRVYFQRNGENFDTYKEVSLSEYNKGMANWKSKPATMINKVAISQAVRDAFPKDFEGIYSEEEMLASGAIPPVDPNTGEVLEEVHDDPVISQEQRQALFKMAKHLGPNFAEILKEMIGKRGYDSTTNLPLSVYNAVLAEVTELAAKTQEEQAANKQENGKPDDPKNAE